MKIVFPFYLSKNTSLTYLVNVYISCTKFTENDIDMYDLIFTIKKDRYIKKLLNGKWVSIDFGYRIDVSLLYKFLLNEIMSNQQFVINREMTLRKDKKEKNGINAYGYLISDIPKKDEKSSHGNYGFLFSLILLSEEDLLEFKSNKIFNSDKLENIEFNDKLILLSPLYLMSPSKNEKRNVINNVHPVLIFRLSILRSLARICKFDLKKFFKRIRFLIVNLDYS